MASSGNVQRRSLEPVFGLSVYVAVQHGGLCEKVIVT